jgi:predicted GIY-YIG superfamily endonuclease
VFHYVYILVSESDPDRHYVGSTADLNTRLAAHNAGKVSYTAKYRPWRIETTVAFRDKQKASGFERYLKSGSAASLPDGISEILPPLEAMPSLNPPSHGC